MTAAATALEGARQRGSRPLIRGSQVALYAAQRHRFSRAAAISVAGAAGPWAAAPYAVAAASRPRIPIARAGGASGDGPQMAKGA